MQSRGPEVGLTPLPDAEKAHPVNCDSKVSTTEANSLPRLGKKGVGPVSRSEDVQLGPVAQAMIGMATQMGKLAGSQEQMTVRMGELAEGQQRLAAAQEDGAERLAAIETRLIEGEHRFERVEKRIGVVEKRLNELPTAKPPPSDGTARFAAILGLAKTYGPWVVAALAAIGAYLTTLATAAIGGGKAP